MTGARDDVARVLVVSIGDVQHVMTTSIGMDLVAEVARLLGSENIRSTRLGTDPMTLWHAEDGPGRPRPGHLNAAASGLAAEYNLPSVAGSAVITGPIQYNSVFPLDADKAERIAARLRRYLDR